MVSFGVSVYDVYDVNLDTRWLWNRAIYVKANEVRYRWLLLVVARKRSLSPCFILYNNKEGHHTTTLRGGNNEDAIDPYTALEPSSQFHLHPLQTILLVQIP